MPQGPPLPDHSPEAQPERRERGIVVTLAALGLAVALLASIPATALRPAAASHRGGRHSTPTTTSPATVATSTTLAAAGVHVAVLAAAGTAAVSTTEGKLTAGHDVLVPEPPIPSSWVSSLPGIVVHYPPGLSAEAMGVARVLGVPSADVSAEQPGTSDGADVVEVFLPAS